MGNFAIKETWNLDLVENLYDDYSGYRNISLTSRDIHDLIYVRNANGVPVLTLDRLGQPSSLFGVPVVPSGNVYIWRLKSVPSKVKQLALAAISKFRGKIGFGQLRQDIAEADGLVPTDRWSIVDAVKDARSISQARENLSDIITD